MTERDAVPKAAQDYYELCRAAAIVNNSRPSAFSEFLRRGSGIRKVRLEQDSDLDVKPLRQADGVATDED